MTDSMSKPEIETLSYKPKVPTLSDMAKVRIEADKAVHAILPIRQPEQPDCSKCRHCGACRVVRPAGEWQFACKCNEDDKIYPPEQPKDNPGPLEKLIMDRIEHDLENIAANLEMLNPETKEQNRAKCVLTLEIAHITGEGGMFDDLKEAFK